MHDKRLQLLAGAVSCALAVSASAAEPVKVFLLGGQSNMVGVGKVAGLPAPYDEPFAGVKFWRGGKWLPLGPGGKSFGPELSFGRAIKGALPDDEIYLVDGAGLIEMGKDFAKALSAAK